MVLVRSIIFLISCFIINLSVEAENNVSGFFIELIHRDSPLLNPNLSHLKHQEIAFEQIRSFGFVHDIGTYLMKIQYGPYELLQLFDTGSEISWIQCLPCIHCFSSRYDPFDPNLSSTYKFEKCHLNQTCPYSVEYEGNSTSSGVLARETIIVGNNPHGVQVENFLFGCGHENRGNFPQKSAGIIGFSPKEKSFITQLSTRHHGKFSFCLTPSSSNHPGRISFGNEAIVTGAHVMRTPLILDATYNILLKAITVGVKKIKNSWNQSENTNENDVAVENKNGKMVVDSGANIMFLSTSMYQKVEKWVRKQIKEETVPSPAEPFTLCYSRSLKDSEIPKIKIHLPGGDLELRPLHTFIGNSTHRCLAIASTNSKPILGNMAMTNFLVGFDLVEKKISFKPTNCSTLH